MKKKRTKRILASVLVLCIVTVFICSLVPIEKRIFLVKIPFMGSVNRGEDMNYRIVNLSLKRVFYGEYCWFEYYQDGQWESLKPLEGYATNLWLGQANPLLPTKEYGAPLRMYGVKKAGKYRLAKHVWIGEYDWENNETIATIYCEFKVKK